MLAAVLLRGGVGFVAGVDFVCGGRLRGGELLRRRLAATFFAARPYWSLDGAAAFATGARDGFLAGVFRAAAFSAGVSFGLTPSVSVSSSHSSASSSLIVFAYISSDARIFFALTYICFSPVERPFSPSRSARFRTTSASS